ncbi:MAG: PH domain-containing protein [Ferruginibacter sp.]
MKYKTSLDNLAKFTTAAVTILFAIIIIGQYFFMHDKTPMIPVYTTVVLVFIYALIFFLRPVSYSISSNEILIRRLIDNIHINRTDVASVELVDKDYIKWSIRLFAVGGLFGYFGKFANKKLGKMTWYATRRDKTILIVTNSNKKIIITPDDPDKFVSDFYKKH